ncbi:MAG: haloacid dehalogenase-like hydrolase [Chloroflexi bacterium]|nr:haloacid dehalogenase-like hydrolase [Chloroflexota bacterium]
MWLIFDFDDSAAVQNVARLLLDRFGGAEFAGLEARYRAGNLLFRDYQELAFRSLPVDVDSLRSYAAEKALLRPGFKESVQAVQAAGGQALVVSAGLDFYIEPVLGKNGYSRLPVTSVTTGRFSGPATHIRYDYPAALPGCPADWAVCKCRVFARARSAGEEIVFVGDGIRSDACAAARADTVFARSRLLGHCQENGIPATPFDDLFPVVRYLETRLSHDSNGRGLS